MDGMIGDCGLYIHGFYFGIKRWSQYNNKQSLKIELWRFLVSDDNNNDDDDD